MKKLIILLIFTVTFNLAYAATKEEFNQHFHTALKIYTKGGKEVKFKKYIKCKEASCNNLSKIWSFKPLVENDTKTIFSRLLAKPKPTKKTLKRIVDGILLEKEKTLTWNLRFKKLSSRNYLLRKCGHPKVINPNKIIKAARKNESRDETLINCLESEHTKLKELGKKEKAKRVENIKTKKLLNSFDCSTITEPFTVLLCKYYSKGVR